MLDGIMIVILIMIMIGLIVIIINYGKFQRNWINFQTNWKAYQNKLDSIQSHLQTLQNDLYKIEHTKDKKAINEQTREQKWAKLYNHLLQKIIGIQQKLELNENQLQKIQIELQSLGHLFEKINSSTEANKISYITLFEEKIQALLTYYDQLQKSLQDSNIKILPAIEQLSQQIQQEQKQNIQIIETMDVTEEFQRKKYQEFQNISSESLHLIHRILETLGNFQNNLQPILLEVSSWQKNPLARLKDLQKKKIAVFVDFENFFISLWDKELEIFDYEMFKEGLVDPESQHSYIVDRIVFFTNKSRWQRKEFYDKKKNISQKEANIIKDALKANGCRIIETDSNIDVPLSLMVITTAQKGEIKHFSLVANDGTYAGLLKELSNMGCTVYGILLGEVSGDLVACYKKLGYHRYHLKSREDFIKFGLRPKNLSQNKNHSVYSITSNHQVVDTSIINKNRISEKIQSLLAIIHKQRLQFLGSELQEVVLKSVHQQILLKKTITRVELIETLIILLNPYIQNNELTKTKINNVLNILWKTNCFEMTKQADETMLLKLSQNYLEYSKFRQEHDAVFVNIAWDANISIAPEEFAKFLYVESSITPKTIEFIESLQKQLSKKSSQSTQNNGNVLDTPNQNNLSETSDDDCPNHDGDNENQHLEIPINSYTEIHNKILAAIRKQKMQFLGPEIQDIILRKIHTFLLENKTVLRNQFPKELESYLQIYIQKKQISKTKIAGMIVILRKNQTIEIFKDSSQNAYISLAKNYFEYSKFRYAHDEVFVRTSLQASLDTSPEALSLLLYGHLEKIRYFQEIIQYQKEFIQNHSEIKEKEIDDNIEI